jgi:hypothetical protein
MELDRIEAGGKAMVGEKSADAIEPEAKLTSNDDKEKIIKIVDEK